MTYLTPFLPQNPALNGDPLGWISCTAYAAAMAGRYDTAGYRAPTGAGVRRLTGDTTGGLTLAQVTLALNRGWNVSLDVRYRYSWTNFMAKLRAGHGAILQGHGIAFNGTKFYAGAPVNHAIFVPPDRRALDPAADGRREGIYDARRRLIYPEYLLRKFAGGLILNLATRQRLGDGLVYAAFTRSRTTTYSLRFKGGESFWVYRVVDTGITSRRAVTFQHDTSTPAGVPRYVAWPGNTGRVLVPVSASSSPLYGEYVAIPQSAVTLVETA